MMKKKLVIILAAAAVLLIAAATVLIVSLSSGVADLSDLINDKAIFVPDPAFSKAEQVTDLTTADLQNSSTSSDLQYFTSVAESGTQNYERHIVYNMATNTIVYTGTETDRTDITVSANSLSWNGNEASYFTVSSTTWADGSKEPGTESYSTTLYDQNGTVLHTVERNITATAQLDLVYFNGVYFRVDENGLLAFAFEYSQMAAAPTLTDKYQDFYYVRNANFISVYNNTLTFVSRYDIPAYATGVIHEILESGDIFLQFRYVTDNFNSEEYDYITVDQNGQTKFKLVTLVIDRISGEGEETDCNYIFGATSNLVQSKEREMNHAFDEDYSVIGTATLIENGRENLPSRLVAIDNSGNVTEFELINGEYLLSLTHISQGYWRADTTGGSSYLINSDGEVTADITNATVCGTMLICDNKIFTVNMGLLYDLDANQMTVKYTFDDSLLLENTNGDTFIYLGSGEPVLLIAKDSAVELVGCHNKFFVTRETTDTALIYHVYNSAGSKLTSIEKNLGTYQFGAIESETERAILISMENKEGKTVYYRLAE